MKFANIFKRQTFLVVTSICVIAIVLIGVSYALFEKRLQSDEMVLTAGDLRVVFTEGQTITGDIYPSSDSDALTGAASYDFTVTNTGSLPAEYDIQIYRDSDATGEFISDQYVRLSLDGGTPQCLNCMTNPLAIVSGESVDEYVYKVGTSSVAAAGETGDSNSHSLKIWIDNDAPSTVAGQTLALKINVISLVQE